MDTINSGTVSNWLTSLEDRGYPYPRLVLYKDGSGHARYGSYDNPLKIPRTSFNDVRELKALLNAPYGPPYEGPLTLELIGDMIRALDEETEYSWYLRDVYIEGEDDFDGELHGYNFESRGDSEITKEFKGGDHLIHIVNEILGRG